MLSTIDLVALMSKSFKTLGDTCQTTANFSMLKSFVCLLQPFMEGIFDRNEADLDVSFGT